MINRRLLLVVLALSFAASVFGCGGPTYRIEAWVADQQGNPVRASIEARAFPDEYLSRFGHKADVRTNSDGYTAFTLSNVGQMRRGTNYEPSSDPRRIGSVIPSDPESSESIGLMWLRFEVPDVHDDLWWTYELKAFGVPFDTGWVPSDHEGVNFGVTRRPYGYVSMPREAAEREYRDAIQVRVRVTKP